MSQVLDTQAYLDRLLALPRPGGENVFSFYDHRVGAVCTDSRLMLIPMDDHMVHRGDGVFESLKYLDRRLYQLDPHLERMRRSSEAIFLAPPCSWEEVRELVLATARASAEPMGYVRILLGRGPGGFGIDPAECPVSSLYIACYRFKLRPESYFEQGVTAYRTSIPAKQCFMAKIKSVNYLPNMLMKREAAAGGYDFPVCFDERGFLAEGAIENVCIVDNEGVLVVPELTNALSGTTLLRAIELAGPELQVRFRTITEAEVQAAREVIIIGTTLDAVGVVRFNDRPVGDGRPGPVARLLRARLVQDLKDTGVPL